MSDLVLTLMRLSCPLLFAALGGLLCERSGVINIALEGFMLVGAFAAASVAYYTGQPWLGWLAGFAAGSLLATLYALAVIEAKADQIVAGTAINILAVGLLPFLGKIFFNSTGSTPALEVSQRFSWEPLGIAIFVGVTVDGLIRWTRLGLWISFAGEHPKALATAGVSVRKIRWLTVPLSGGLAGWGGATLSLALSSSYSPLMTAGRGFIALAALITGKWRPLPTIAACFAFALMDLMQIRLQGLDAGGLHVPVQFIQILPYLLTLVALGGFLGLSRAPKAVGKDIDGSEVL